MLTDTLRVSAVFASHLSVPRSDICVRNLGVLHSCYLHDAAQLPPEQDHFHLQHGVSSVGGASVEKQPCVPRCG